MKEKATRNASERGFDEEETMILFDEDYRIRQRFLKYFGVHINHANAYAEQLREYQ